MFSVRNSCRAGLRSAARPSRALTSFRANSNVADPTIAKPGHKQEAKDELEGVDGQPLDSPGSSYLSQAIRAEDTETDPDQDPRHHPKHSFYYRVHDVSLIALLMDQIRTRH